MKCQIRKLKFKQRVQESYLHTLSVWEIFNKIL